MESIYSKLKEKRPWNLGLTSTVFYEKLKYPTKSHKARKVRLSSTKKGQDRIILTANKGVAMVVMGKEDYITKAESLLSQPAYRVLPKDPQTK